MATKIDRFDVDDDYPPPNFFAPDDDFVWVAGGNDEVDVFGGDDEVHGGVGNDAIRGGEGNDKLFGYGSLTAQVQFFITLGALDGGFVVGLPSAIYDDALVATWASAPIFPDNDLLSGGSGDDSIYGGIGDDVLNGGFSFGGEDAGFDFLSGGAGDDVLYDPVEDRFRGRGFDEMVGGAPTSDLLVPERDVAFVHRPAEAQVRWRYEAPVAGSAGFELRDGSFWLGRRVIVETYTPGAEPGPGEEPEPDVILDRLHLYGVEYLRIYDDRLQAVVDAARLRSDPTSRTEILDLKNLIPLIGFTEFNDIYPSSEQFPALAGLDPNVFDPSQANNLDGLEGDDSIVAGAKNDTVSGGEGTDPRLGKNDTLLGGGGDDSLLGHLGEDWLYGGANKDTLLGGTGKDVLSGGGGDDSLATARDVLLERDVLGGGGGSDTIRSVADRIEVGVNVANALAGLAAAPVLIGGIGQDHFDVTGSATIITFDPTKAAVADPASATNPETITADSALQRFFVRGYAGINLIDTSDIFYVEKLPPAGANAQQTYILGRDQQDETKWWLIQLEIKYSGFNNFNTNVSLNSAVSFAPEAGYFPYLSQGVDHRAELDIFGRSLAQLEFPEATQGVVLAPGRELQIRLSPDAPTAPPEELTLNLRRIESQIKETAFRERLQKAAADLLLGAGRDQITDELIDIIKRVTLKIAQEKGVDLTFGAIKNIAQDINVYAKSAVFLYDVSQSLYDLLKVMLSTPPPDEAATQRATVDFINGFKSALIGAVSTSKSLDALNALSDVGLEIYEYIAIKFFDMLQVSFDSSVTQFLRGIAPPEPMGARATQLNTSIFEAVWAGNEFVDRSSSALDEFYFPFDGNDTVFDGSGNAYIKAGSGSGDDYYDGGAGRDFIDFASASRDSPLLIDLVAGRAVSIETGEDTLIDIEDAAGGAGSDTIRGNAAANELVGEGGNDSIAGGGGEDVLLGAAGQDTFWGSLADFGGDFIADLQPGETIFVVGEALSGATARLEGGARLVIDRDADGRPEATIQLAGTFRLGSPSLVFEQTPLGTAISVGSRFADVFTLSEDTALPATAANNLLANDDITGNGSTRLELIEQAAHGTVTLAGDGTFTYTPDADFFGNDAFVYRWSNDTDAGPTTTVALRVRADNDAPTAIADNVTTPRGVPVLVAPDTLLANDVDIDSDSLAITGVGQAVNGTVVFEGGIIAFTPNAGFRGQASFNYTVDDGDLSSQGTVMVTVTDPIPRTIYAHNGRLWVTDGTPGGTTAVTTPSLQFFSLLETPRFTPLGDGRLVFAANGGGSGFEPWITDGTAAGTYVLKDIAPGSGRSDPNAFASLPDGRVIFSAQSTVIGPYGDIEEDIWVTDGSASGTFVLSDAFAGARNFTVLDNNTVIFSAWTTFSSQSSLFRLDLSTDSIQEFAGPALLGSLDEPHSFTRITDQRIVLFEEFGETWVTDGTAAGTTLMPSPVSVRPPTIYSTPPVVPLDDGRLVFISRFDGAAWVTDGTTAGTFRLQPRGEGAQGSLVRIGDNQAAFVTNKGDAAITDGTASGTFVIDLFPPGPDTRGPFMPLADGRFLFPATANPATIGQELYVSDGTLPGTSLVKDVWPGGVFSNGSLTWANSGLAPQGYLFDQSQVGQTGDGRWLFPAQSGPSEVGTWITDGTADGTFLLTSATGVFARPFGLLRSGDSVNDIVRADRDGPYFVAAGGTLLVRTADGVLTGDTGPSGQTLTAELVSGTMNGSIDLRSDGGFLYTPIAGFVGVDSFVYRARTETGEVSEDVAVQIGITGAQDARIGTQVLDIVEDSPDTPMGLVIPFFGQDELTVTILRVPPAARGQVIQSDGVTPMKVGDVLTEQALETLLFRPASNACGPAGVFRYRVTDGEDVRVQEISIKLTNVVDTLTGTSGTDRLTGTHCADRIEGLAGNDVLFGVGGTDTIIGGDGDDTLGGLLGAADDMTGGAGNDVYLVGDAADIIREEPGGGIDTVRTRLTTFTLSTELENLTYVGNQGDFFGTGNASDNLVRGGIGNDSIRGEAGNDTLIGGAGQDTLTGGAGNDQFRINAIAESTVAAPDLILDFSFAAATGIDRLDLRAIDANAGLAGNQAFIYRGANFTGAAGDLRVQAQGGGVFIAAGDVNGDAIADVAITIQSATGPVAGWFLL